MEKNFHTYHMVNSSPWPFLMGFSIMSTVVGLIKLFNYMSFDLFFFSITVSILVSWVWWRDVIRESTYQGSHSSKVLSGLMIGMILFIVSEIFFFLSFFWAFFHSSLNPTIELGSVWPPAGVMVMSPFQVPLLNTVILLASGVSVTWAHQSIISEDEMMGKFSLFLTCILGLYFLMLQGFEYMMSEFCISDSIYGSTFFMATGFHGFHVIVGTLFLTVMLLRMMMKHFSNSHHFGFESAAWYWHFVDVVWLFLFSVVYWWGS